MNGVPAHINHNSAKQDFTVPETSDLSLIGEYPMNVQAEISYFSDHTKTATTVKNAEFDFTVFMTPCSITDYIDSLRIVEIRYALGEP